MKFQKNNIKSKEAEMGEIVDCSIDVFHTAHSSSDVKLSLYFNNLTKQLTNWLIIQIIIHQINLKWAPALKITTCVSNDAGQIII